MFLWKTCFRFSLLDEIIEQCETWIRELQDTSLAEKRINAAINQHATALLRHTNDLKKELDRLATPDGLEIPNELKPILLTSSINSDAAANVSSSNSAQNVTSTTTTITNTTSVSTLSTKVNPSSSSPNDGTNLSKDSKNQTSPKNESSSQTKNDKSSNSSSEIAQKPMNTNSSVTIADGETQQSGNSSNSQWDTTPPESPSANMNTYDVTITHSSSLFSDWGNSETPTGPIGDGVLIYEDLLDDEEDIDDDLDVGEMLDYDGDPADGYLEEYD